MLQRTKLKKINKDENMRKKFLSLMMEGKTKSEAINIIIPNKKNLSKDFYKTLSWKKIRYEVLKESNGKCCLCGRSAKDGVILHVDHIIPLSVDWGKRLDKDNLQVLCDDCNLGKMNKDCIDWR